MSTKMTATVEFEIESNEMTKSDIKTCLIEKMAYEMDDWLNGEGILKIEFKTENNERSEQSDCIIN